MRRTLIVGALAAAMAVPSVAGARTYCEQRNFDRQVAGTVIGAAGGAIVGNAIAHGNGALIGGLGGAVIGNQAARIHCPERHVYYRYPRGHAAASAAVPAGCAYETRPYYDERGRLIYAPTRVCR